LNGMVVDASVALAWCFPDEVSDYADSVLLAVENQTIVVPAIWPVEITNALLVGQRRKRITQSDVRRFVELFKGLDVTVETQSVADSVSNIFPLAQNYRLSAYDAAYLDVAVRHEITLATLDADLQRAAKAIGISIFKV
jgi:predicted nucleic acid-binding protein